MQHLIQAENLQHVFREKNNKGAEITVKSVVTGKDYTFKVNRKLFKDKWYTHISVETQYQDFQRIGTYKNGSIFNKGVLVQSPSSDAISWILRSIESKKFDKVNSGVQIMHTGNCIVCGKKLTDSYSIECGVGPICRTFN